MANKFVDLAGLQNFKSKIETLFAKQSDIPTNTSQLTNDSDYQNSEQVSETVESTVSQLKTATELILSTTWEGDDENGYSQVVALEGITDKDIPIFDVKLVELETETNDQKRAEFNKITDCWAKNGNITFYASSKPAIELTLLAKIPVPMKIETSSSGGSTGIRYELDKEVETGDYWIDGKPIYQKTLFFESYNNDQNVDIGEQVDKFIKFEGVCRYNNVLTVNFPFFTANAATNMQVVAYDNQPNQITLWKTGTFDNLYVTSFYTKK